MVLALGKSNSTTTTRGSNHPAWTIFGSIFQLIGICYVIEKGFTVLSRFGSRPLPKPMYEIKEQQRLSSLSTTSSTTRTSTSTSTVFNFEPHREAMEYATQPGRGYKPKPERASTWLNDVNGSYWWLNAEISESFSIAELDQVYPKKYFAQGHPVNVASVYVEYVLLYGSLLLGKDVTSVVEFGNGGGYFAKQFSTVLLAKQQQQQQQGQHDHKYFITVEGTGAGIAETLEKWNVPTEQVIQHDLRYPLFIGKRFDIAVCTEVVEHVEPPFSSQIVSTLVLHSDIIWFSFKPDGVRSRAFINHSNERPLKMWKNLFDFYGYDIIMIPYKVQSQIAYRGSFLAYRRDTINTDKKITEQTLVKNILNKPVDP